MLKKLLWDWIPQKIQDNLILKYIGFFKIPLVNFVGLKMVNRDENKCTLSMPLNRKTKNHAIMGEISYGKNKQKPKNVKNNFYRFLKDTKIIQNRTEILDFVTKDIKYSYPVPTHDKKDIINSIKVWLRNYSVHTVGRFAEWDYINSDEALKRGLEIGKKISKQ